MWEDLSVNHFLKHSNHLKGTLKMFYNGTMRFGYCLTFNLLMLRYYRGESKPILYLYAVHCKFLPFLEEESGSCIAVKQTSQVSTIRIMPIKFEKPTRYLKTEEPIG